MSVIVEMNMKLPWKRDKQVAVLNQTENFDRFFMAFGGGELKPNKEGVFVLWVKGAFPEAVSEAIQVAALNPDAKIAISWHETESLIHADDNKATALRRYRETHAAKQEAYAASPEGSAAAARSEAEARARQERDVRAATRRKKLVAHSKYQFPEGMIIKVTGYGREQDLPLTETISAGLQWLDDHPKANTESREFDRFIEEICPAVTGKSYVAIQAIKEARKAGLEEFIEVQYANGKVYSNEHARGIV